MSIALNNTAIKSIFYNGTALKSLYLNGIKVWSSLPLIKIKPLRDLYPDTYQTVLSLNFPSDEFDINIDENAGRYMFYCCYNLTSLDVSNFDTSKVTDMESMFDSCASLTSLNLSSFDTSKVTNMNRMFCHCKNLTSLNLSNFDTSKVTDMSSMFNDCNNLTEIKGVIDMKSCAFYACADMFQSCDKLSGVKIKNPPARFNGAGLKPEQYTIVA